MKAKGWYPDPQDPEQYRWWNGESWTSDVRKLEEKREAIEDAGEEIELEQGARDAIEKRRQALREAGRKYHHDEPRKRRRRGSSSDAPKEALEESVSQEEALEESAPDLEEPPTFEGDFPELESASVPDFFSKEAPPKDQPKKEPRAARRSKPKLAVPKKQKIKKRSKQEAGRLVTLIQKEVSRLFPKKPPQNPEEDLQGSFPWKRLALYTGPALLVVAVAGLVVLLPGDNNPTGKLQVATQKEQEQASQKPEKSPEQILTEKVERCIDTSPAVNSFVEEATPDGEKLWKIIFVDDNYELITVTEKSDPKAAKLETSLSATSFVAAAGGRFTILGPLRGIEGSNQQASSELLRYIASLKSCLGKI